MKTTQELVNLGPLGDAVHLDRPLPGYIQISTAKASELAKNGTQLFVYRQVTGGAMWFVKEGEL